ncbi:transcription initiation factor IIE, alpha subunit, putative [Plasmodium gallinaceum]|uniref:Transcription initiation factor IIE, alpha subunit, putative n=1 Tax=Plasmodium gallinaceum TaxID=5849 RepID=A0A1J1H168_PLAGA|nr:transcription initiation factor IIE, alpha subunit, putative [Plasmodium gallinaceum]CRG98205.1 transcription initiation factor IIE, alpha subunit, putative [Plasmodium gallinaceum]
MDKTKEIFYDKEKKFFLYLMIYISRFFMSDEEIVIFDLFIHNECLYLEKDIINSINMNEHKIRSILSKLLRDKFIIEVQKYKNNEKGSNSQTYYCLNNYIVYVIDFRIKQMENEIQKKKNESDIYICNYCNCTYSQLDAQTLPLDSYDAHFLCFCNNKIELIENDDNNDEKIYNKYTKYLNILKEYIEKLKNYFIPLYTEKFNRSNLNSSNSFLSDNSSDGSVTNNSSEISLTNNSSLISQIHLNESIENGKRKKEEIYTDTCSSVIRKNKKIKICMNVKTKNIIRKNLNDDKIKISNTINDTKEENIINKNKNNDTSENNESIEKSNQNAKNITNEQQTKEPEFPLFFIQKFNKKFTLIDAQKLQQDMSQEEFENFMELQDIYLDKL